MNQSESEPSELPDTGKSRNERGCEKRQRQDSDDGLSRLPDYGRSLLRVEVPVVVSLAAKKVSISQLAELCPGTIFQFNTSCEEPVSLEIDGQKVAFGEAVKVGDKFGVVISSVAARPERFQAVAGSKQTADSVETKSGGRMLHLTSVDSMAAERCEEAFASGATAPPTVVNDTESRNPSDKDRPPRSEAKEPASSSHPVLDELRDINLSRTTPLVTFALVKRWQEALAEHQGPPETELRRPPDTVDDILPSERQTAEDLPFAFLQKVDSQNLVTFLIDEHPQTIALVLSHLIPSQAAEVLSALPAERQLSVLRRIATMARTNPELIAEVETALEHRMADVLSQQFEDAGGVTRAAEIVNAVELTTARCLLENLAQEDPDLVEEIRGRMAVFEESCQESRSMEHQKPRAPIDE